MAVIRGLPLHLCVLSALISLGSSMIAISVTPAPEDDGGGSGCSTDGGGSGSSTDGSAVTATAFCFRNQ